MIKKMKVFVAVCIALILGYMGTLGYFVYSLNNQVTEDQETLKQFKKNEEIYRSNIDTLENKLEKANKNIAKLKKEPTPIVEYKDYTSDDEEDEKEPVKTASTPAPTVTPEPTPEGRDFDIAGNLTSEDGQYTMTIAHADSVNHDIYSISITGQPVFGGEYSFDLTGTMGYYDNLTHMYSMDLTGTYWHQQQGSQPINGSIGHSSCGGEMVNVGNDSVRLNHEFYYD